MPSRREAPVEKTDDEPSIGVRAKQSQQQTIETERDFTDRLLQGILPSHAPELSGYQFYQYYCPAANTGGDFYDYVSCTMAVSWCSWPISLATGWKRPCS